MVGVSVGIAGCSTTNESQNPSTAPSTAPLPLPNGSESPPTQWLRNPTGDAAVRTSRAPDLRAEDWTPSHWLVTSSEDHRALEFTSDVTGVRDVRSLLAATDLSSATILIFQRSVPACLKRTVEEVRWDAERVSLDWTTTQRDAECDADDPPHTEALFIRIPAAVTDLDYFGSTNA